MKRDINKHRAGRNVATPERERARSGQVEQARGGVAGCESAKSRPVCWVGWREEGGYHIKRRCRVAPTPSVTRSISRQSVSLSVFLSRVSADASPLCLSVERRRLRPLRASSSVCPFSSSRRPPSLPAFTEQPASHLEGEFNTPPPARHPAIAR